MTGRDVLAVGGVRLAGVTTALPATAADCLESLRGVCGDKAADIVKATGIRRRRIAAPGVTALDLCTAAAERLFARLGAKPADFGAVLSVSFTQRDRMPAASCQAQARLGLPENVLATDLSLACSGYPYGLYMAALLARATGRKVLLLDGDVQSAHLKDGDAATLPVLADGGTASVVEPCEGAAPWLFAFGTDGAEGAALRLSEGGTIAMDGFSVFRFVAIRVTRFLKGFLAAANVVPDALAAFVPHQANVFMVRELAKSVGVPAERTWISGDELGNLASASVPATLAFVGAKGARPAGKILLSGFGGGLSASAALLEIGEIPLECFDCGR